MVAKLGLVSNVNQGLKVTAQYFTRTVLKYPGISIDECSEYIGEKQMFLSLPNIPYKVPCFGGLWTYSRKGSNGKFIHAFSMQQPRRNPPVYGNHK